MSSAFLVLEDGRVFSGKRFGSHVQAVGEVVFNTSMVGYQEIITDPSYAGQMVVMTYPMMGNYGITPEDCESRNPFLSGLIVKDISGLASSWRQERTLDSFLKDFGIAGFYDIDTRALVKHIRSYGTMRGIIGDESVGGDQLLDTALSFPKMSGKDLASVVSENRKYKWDRPSCSFGPYSLSQEPGVEKPTRLFHVVVYDFGVKRNILRCLVDIGATVTVVPANTSAEEVLGMHPDGVVLSNGPGDPEPVTYAVENIKKLIGNIPIFGICLGYQLLAIACGGRTYKMKFGHHGGNHPVKDLSTGRVEITSHNHGFAVDIDSLPRDEIEITHIDLNDKTLEGFRLVNAPAFGVQYHPEAAPGPKDSSHLFESFASMMKKFNWRFTEDGNGKHETLLRKF